MAENDRVRTIGCKSMCLLAAFLAILAAGCSDASFSGNPDAAAGPVGALAHDGRWLVDETGRVVLLHGVNFVQKFPPIPPAAAGFDADDAAFLREQGFNVVRLGAVFGALMPSPGQLDEDYVKSFMDTVRVLAAERIYVQVDFHQDGYGPLVHGNGFPEWATLIDGLPNPPDPFPTYYVTNPALQRAFDNFWDNRPGPDGSPLQESYAAAVRAVADAVASEPYVLGYDLMNEPWPGAAWQPCVTACPALEQSRMVPFQEKASDAALAVAPGRLVFVEPFVLFNFGQATTTLPGTRPGAALSFHSYALDVAGEDGVVLRALEAAERDRAPLVATEFGATLDATVLQRLANGFDANLIPWLEWDYIGTVIADPTRTAGADNLRSREAFDALVRPYLTAVAGVPTAMTFDRASATFETAFVPPSPLPDGRAARTTVIEVPARVYPDGYRARVRGAWVDSPPCASRLILRTKPRATAVTVQVTPRAAGSARACRRAAVSS